MKKQPKAETLGIRNGNWFLPAQSNWRAHSVGGFEDSNLPPGKRCDHTTHWSSFVLVRDSALHVQTTFASARCLTRIICNFSLSA